MFSYHDLSKIEMQPLYNDSTKEELWCECKKIISPIAFSVGWSFSIKQRPIYV